MKYTNASNEEKQKLSSILLKEYNNVINEANKKNNTSEKSLNDIFIAKENKPTPLESTAQNFLTKYLGKAKHQINPFDKTSAFRLEVYEITEKTLDEVDDIMDLVEDGMDVDALVKHFAQVEINISELRRIMDVLDTTIRGVMLHRPFMNMLDNREILENNINMDQKQRDQLKRILEQRQMRDVTNLYLKRRRD